MMISESQESWFTTILFASESCGILNTKFRWNREMKLLDEASYGRENKHINIDQTINIDFIRESNVLHEVKKSKKIEEASVWQVKYYLYYLKKKGMDCVTGKIDYPLLKKSVTVELQDEDALKMEEVLSDIKQIIGQSLPDEARRKNICKSCAYFDLCFI